MAVAMLLSITLPMLPAAAAPLPPPPYYGYSVPVTGRTLTPLETGDFSSNWIEIAQYGKYSLIVRTNFINQQIYQFNQPEWQTPNYYSTTYMSCYPRNAINNWFNSLVPFPVKQGIDYLPDFLPANARLRNYTMQHNAMGMLGTRYTVTTPYDGLSLPTPYQVGSGLDIAFALSYSEAANYLSITRTWKGITNAEYYSPWQAAANFRKIVIPTKAGWNFGMWLRSPGSISSTASALTKDGYAHEFDIVHQPLGASFGYGLCYPALWVDSGIFNPEPPPPPPFYTLTYNPNGGIGTENSTQYDPNTYALIMDQGYTNGSLVQNGWNTKADGTGTPYTNFSTILMNDNITLYAQWKRETAVIYHANGGNGADYVDNGVGGTFTIRGNMFSFAQHSFVNWNTDPGGKGAILPPGLTFSNFVGTLHLYAIWTEIF